MLSNVRCGAPIGRFVRACGSGLDSAREGVRGAGADASDDLSEHEGGCRPASEQYGCVDEEEGREHAEQARVSHSAGVYIKGSRPEACATGSVAHRRDLRSSSIREPAESTAAFAPSLLLV